MRECHNIKLYKDNKITIPAEYVKYLDLKVGDSIMVSLCKDGLRIQSDRMALDSIRSALSARLGNVDLAQEILNNRKLEVKREAK